MTPKEAYQISIDVLESNLVGYDTRNGQNIKTMINILASHTDVEDKRNLEEQIWKQLNNTHMTVKEVCEAIGIDTNKVDYALPQQWVDYMRDKLGFDVRGHFVYSYEKARSGAPRPITREGVTMLKAYNKNAGTNYPTNYQVWEL